MDNTCEVKEFEATPSKPLYKVLGSEVGGYIEIVRPKFAYKTGMFKPNMCFICNEEGLMISGLEINEVATLLYGMTQPILGNIVILNEFMTPDGMDLGGLSDADIAYLKDVFDFQ